MKNVNAVITLISYISRLTYPTVCGLLYWWLAMFVCSLRYGKLSAVRANLIYPITTTRETVFIDLFCTPLFKGGLLGSKKVKKS